ncbi:FAD-binding oxidoreductase [Paenibacillus ehimensis]|uniref:FAD-binding oxidoreductase n=1 Tax=Paenibacillus ehimensis TaxID=79264 RepID=UPI002DBF8243|nr:FAD-binding oxidoreductase [Paenibacillus ehimensis]MEC0208557.1 FAD-binding oxidoreductase [Paenibacillus ehimensis]
MALTAGLTGRVIWQGQPGYEEARRGFNARFSKYPAVIVYCQITQDVVNAVLWARQYKVPFRIRCGGHSYEAYCLVDGGLVIDTSGLLQLQIYERQGVARIGAGFRLLPLYEELWKKGLALPGGTCPGVGISGLTLGGGFGLLSRLYGMTCDNVIELEMVTAQGNAIRANNEQHPDLFWACRGAGDGSYGVVTSFTFRVHPIDKVAYYSLTWDFAQLKEVVRYWQNWASRADNRLTSVLLLLSQQGGTIHSSGVFVGEEQELRSIVQPLQKVVPPKTVNFRTMTWIEAARLFAGTPVQQAKFKNSSAYAYEPFSDAALDVLSRHLQNTPGAADMVAFDAYGGAIKQVSPEATAFAHRNALFVMQYQAYWNQDAEAALHIDWVERFRQAMLPYTRGAYRDYCDSQIADWPTAYFGDNLARLRRVKQLYDPENLFRFEQSIPPW